MTILTTTQSTARPLAATPVDHRRRSVVVALAGLVLAVGAAAGIAAASDDATPAKPSADVTTSVGASSSDDLCPLRFGTSC